MKKLLLLGDEAIAQGALDAGLSGVGLLRVSTVVLSVPCPCGRDIRAVWRGKPALRVIYRRRRKNVGGRVSPRVTNRRESSKYPVLISPTCQNNRAAT